MIEFERGRWLFQLYWSDWKLTKVNWIEFTFFKLKFEIDYFCKTVEVYAGLIGINLRVVWVYKPW